MKAARGAPKAKSKRKTSPVSAKRARRAAHSLHASPFKSLTASVAKALQSDLVTARYLPGAKLRIAQLGEHYGVSPGAVREALSRLISEGLVEFTEQRGFRAAPVSKAALMDITRTRVLLDVHALRESIRNGDVNWEADVLATHHRLAKCPLLKSGSRRVSDEWVGLHRTFHRTLIAGCGSDWLLRFHDLLFDQTERYRQLSTAFEQIDRMRTRDTPAEHAAIVRAAVARDAKTAARLLEQHYLTTANLVIDSQAQGLASASERTA
jgi:GntR family carbon starvation induced transcriptional regulator